MPRFVLVLLVAFLGPSALADSSQHVFIGTYTGPQSKGIYVCDFSPATGKVSQPRLAAEVASPSFLAIHPSQKFLYAVSEAGEGKVLAYAIHSDGSLKQINFQPSGGTSACFISTDPTGRIAMVANYGSGSFEALPINEDGSLAAPSTVVQDAGHGVNGRQEGPHAHSINSDPAGHFAFGCDLGLDAVIRFTIDPQNRKLDIDPPLRFHVSPGSGPRHLVFHPSAKFVYVVNELSSTVTGFAYDAFAGRFSELQTVSTLAEDFKGQNTCAEIQIHPNGKFLYASNRGDDSIAIFTIDPATGKLTPTSRPKTGGKMPRNFRLDPAGQYLFAAHQDAGGVTTFKVDPGTGSLTATGQAIDLVSPVCVKFVPMP